MFGGTNSDFLSDNDIQKKKRGYISPFTPMPDFLFLLSHIDVSA